MLVVFYLSSSNENRIQYLFSKNKNRLVAVFVQSDGDDSSPESSSSSEIDDDVADPDAFCDLEPTRDETDSPPPKRECLVWE